jgi:hypothetical protein
MNAIRDYKELDGLNNQERDERVQQDIEQKNRILGFELQNQLLMDELAYTAMGGHVVGFGDELSAEEQAHHSKQSSSIVLSS